MYVCMYEDVFETRRLPELMLPQQEAKGFVGHGAEISNFHCLLRCLAAV